MFHFQSNFTAKENLEPNSQENGSATNDTSSEFKPVVLDNFVVSPIPVAIASSSSAIETTTTTPASNELPSIPNDLNEDGTEKRALTFSEILYHHNNGKHFPAIFKTVQNNANMSNNQLK